MKREEVEAAVGRLRDAVDNPTFFHTVSEGPGGYQNAEAVRSNPVDPEDLARVLLAVYDHVAQRP